MMQYLKNIWNSFYDPVVKSTHIEPVEVRNQYGTVFFRKQKVKDREAKEVKYPVEYIKAYLKEHKISPQPGKDVDWETVELRPEATTGWGVQWVDAKGRKQRGYRALHHEKQKEIKYERLKALESKVVQFMQQTREEALKGSEAALVNYLAALTGLRRGRLSSFKETGHRGLSTLSTENVRVHKDEVYFKFIGKSNAENTATVEDKELARLLEKKIGEAVERNKAESREITVSFYDKQGTKKYLEKRIKTNFLFTVSDEEVEQYFKQNLGKEFKVKDLRTAAANRVAKKSLGEGEVPKNKKELESKLKEMYAEVARTLNNTLSVAKSSYVDPKVVENYVNKVIKQWERKKK